MALEEDEVQYTKLLDAFHELFNDLKNEKRKNKVLLKENEKLFKMKENETISEMVTRFTDITNSLASLGKEYTKSKKFARSFVHSHQIGRRRQLQSKKRMISQQCR